MDIKKHEPLESRLTFVRTLTAKDKGGRFLSEYRCECGNTVLAARSTVEGKNVRKSCGCIKAEASRRNAAIARTHLNEAVWDKLKTHGLSKTRFYLAYRGMMNRCYNSAQRTFPDYGGRGIRVADRWHTFENFRDDMYESYQRHMETHNGSGTTIERIDVNGDYEPGNCRWATLREQARNKRSSRILTHQGRSQSVADWSDETGIAHSTILARLNRGWSVEDSLTRPLRKAMTLTYNGRTQRLDEWQRELGVGQDYLAAKMRQGITGDELFNIKRKGAERR